MARSIYVPKFLTSDKRPALIRNKAAKTATSIAEYFRDKGERAFDDGFHWRVFSMAREMDWHPERLRERISASVYSEIPKLLESRKS